MCNRCDCGGQAPHSRKHTRVTMGIMLALALAPVAWTVAHGAQESEHHHASEPASQHYACPMHPQEVGHKGDRCAICNMYLTEPVAAAHGEQDHPGHESVAQDRQAAPYACPMHPEQTGEQGDRCPICNMFLTEQEEEVVPAHDHGDHDHGAAQPVLDPLPAALELGDAGPAGTIKYVCPMHPQIVSDAPGTCPICGMNLEKVTLGAASEEVVVGVSGGMQQALGVRTETVEQGTLWRYIKTLGTVQYNEDAISHIHTRAVGWVEKLAVHAVGDKVEKGQLLYELYSPDLVSAQDDYLQARDYLSADPKRGQNLLRKARLRLELLGMSDSVIRQLERTGESLYRVPFYAPHAGVVSAITIRDGMYIQPGETQIELVDLSTVWVIAEVFENEQSWLEIGRPAEVTAAAQGLFGLEGQIDYIYPELDPVTRAMQVRVTLPNDSAEPAQQLRPGSLVDVELFGGPRRDLLIVPTEALILTGRENRVVVQRDDTGFASVPVRLGMISQGRAEVLEGLQAGDRVVVSGQFLLDSEASIQGSLQRMSQGSAAPADSADPHAGHQH